MLGKNQNANEIFNCTLWKCAPKNSLVAVPNLEMSLCHAVAHFNIGMKASVLIIDKLNFASNVYKLKGCKKLNLRSFNLANQQACLKNKLRQQILSKLVQKPKTWPKTVQPIH